MIASLNLSIEVAGGGLSVSEIDNAAYLELGSQPGMVQRTWQLPAHDVRYVAAVGLERRAVRGAITEYLNGLLSEGKVG